MRMESLSARLDFDEHRARSLEGVVQYRPDALAGGTSEGDREAGEDDAPETAEAGPRAARRRRRRRPRRRTGLAMPGEAAAVETALAQGDVSRTVAAERDFGSAPHKEVGRPASDASDAPGGELRPSGTTEPSDQ
jgi:hypothetical protein